MKALIGIVLSLAVVLIGCSNFATGKSYGLPSRVSVTGAKGLFVSQNSNNRSVGSIVTVVGNGGILQRLNIDGTTGAATFTDSNGNTLNVTVNTAEQVSTNYVLVNYTYTPTSGTPVTNDASIDLSTGVLTDLPIMVSNWNMIRHVGDVIYLVSANALYSIDLTTNTPTQISATGEYINSQTWLHLDGAGDIYGIYGSYSNGMIDAKATLFKPDGTEVSFTGDTWADMLWNMLPGSSAKQTSWIAEDSTNSDVYELDFSTGALKVYPMVFTTSGMILTRGTGTTLLSSISTTNFAHYGIDDTIQNSLFANSQEGIIVSSTSGVLSAKDYNMLTGPVPVDTYTSTGQNVQVPTNWKFESGQLYAGPIVNSGPSAATNTINLVTLNNDGSVTDPPLVKQSGITSWAVVNGQVLYVDGSGTYSIAGQVGSTAQQVSTSTAPVSGVTN